MEATHEPDGFTNLLAGSLPRLRRHLRRRAGSHLLDRESISDLLQSVCLAMVSRRRHWRGANGERGFRGWLARVAEYKLADRGRRRRAGARNPDREVPQEHADEALSAIPAAAAEPNLKAQLTEDLEAMDQALARLAASDRELIVRLRLKDEAPSSVAASLGLSVSTMRVRLHRALARLMVAMQDRPAG